VETDSVSHLGGALSDVEKLAAIIVKTILEDNSAADMDDVGRVIAEAVLAKNYVIPKRWAQD
jgi:hypothetical protein